MADTGVRIQVSVKGDLTPFEKALHRLYAIRWTDMHNEIGSSLRNLALDRFKRGVGPDGTAWEPSGRVKAIATASKAARSRKRGKTLVETGRLRASIHWQASEEGVAVGTDVKYAAIHQFGGETGSRRGRFDMIARPYLGVNKDGELADEDRGLVERIVERHLQAALAGRAA